MPDKVQVPDMLERLAKWRGTVTAAAQELGISRNYAYIMARHGIPPATIDKWRQQGLSLCWMEDGWLDAPMPGPWDIDPVERGYRVGPCLIVDVESTDRTKRANAEAIAKLSTKV